MGRLESKDSISARTSSASASIKGYDYAITLNGEEIILSQFSAWWTFLKGGARTHNFKTGCKVFIAIGHIFLQDSIKMMANLLKHINVLEERQK